MSHPEPFLDILYEDEDMLVVNKPAGMSVHPSLKEPAGTLVDALLAYVPGIASVGEDATRPGIVHRLDKDTSGVLVTAKNQKTFDELKQLFKSRKVRKRYLALVDGRVKAPRGVITLPIGRTGIRRTTPAGRRKPTKLREAETVYIVRKRFPNATLLELQPKTGRMHQLRVHMKALEHPVLGDKLYGGKKVSQRAPRQMLHASSVSFTRADGTHYAFDVEPPEDFQDVLAQLAAQDE